MCLIRNSLVWVILDPTNHTYHNHCTSKRHSCVQGPLWKRFWAGRFRAILLLRTIFMHSQLHLLLRVLKTHHNHWTKQMVNTWLTQRIEGVSGVLATINKNKKNYAPQCFICVPNIQGGFDVAVLQTPWRKQTNYSALMITSFLGLCRRVVWTYNVTRLPCIHCSLTDCSSGVCVSKVPTFSGGSAAQCGGCNKQSQKKIEDALSTFRKD